MPTTFRARINELLETSGKSQADVAREFHVAKQTVSAWATGQSEPKPPVVNALAAYFGVTAGWLQGKDVPKELERRARIREAVGTCCGELNNFDCRECPYFDKFDGSFHGCITWIMGDIWDEFFGKEEQGHGRTEDENGVQSGAG